jgi:hypothetical protein
MTPGEITLPERDRQTCAFQAAGPLTVAKEDTLRTQTAKIRMTAQHSVRILKLEEAQQALTSSEFVLYSRIRTGTAKLKSRECGEDRLWAASMNDLADQTGLSDRTCQRAMHGLKLKGAIEIARQADCVGRVPPEYRAKNYGAILSHLKTQGYTHVLIGRNPMIIRPDDPALKPDSPVKRDSANSRPWPRNSLLGRNAPVRSSIGSLTGDMNSPGDIMSSGETMSGEPGDIVTGGPGDIISPPLYIGIKERNTGSNELATAVSVDVNAVAAAMAEYALGDQAAAERIVESSLARCPACTTADVIAAVRSKAAQLRRQQNVQNPVGVLIASCAGLVPNNYAERVAAEAKEREQAARRILADRVTSFSRGLECLPQSNKWQQILGRVKLLIPEHSFETWLKPTRFAGIRNRILQVCIPCSEFAFISEKFAACINQAIRDLRLPISAIKIRTAEEFVQMEEDNDAR